MAPKTKAQLEAQKEAKKARILEAALKVFASHGYDGATINMIAKEAGMAKGLLYSYYESKEDLLEQLMSYGLMKANGMMDGGEPVIETAEDLMAIIRQMIGSVRLESDFWRLYLMVVLQPNISGRFMDMAKGFLDGYLQIFMTYFERKGSPDPMAEALLLGAVFDGLMFDLMVMPDDYPAERVVEIIRLKFT